MKTTRLKSARKAPPKARVVHARYSEDEYAAVVEAAKAAGMTVSSFFRSLTLEGAGVRPFLTAQDRAVLALLLEDMRKIGINLNQMARSLNSGHAVHAEDVGASIRDVQAIAAHTMLELRALARRPGRRQDEV
jgi:hypothetical protein